MSLLFKKKLKLFKLNGIKKTKKENTSLPCILPKDYISFTKKTFNNIINQDISLVKALNLNDSKTNIPFIQITNNTKINITNNEIERKRKEKLSQWELKELDMNSSNIIQSNINSTKIKESKQRVYLERLQIFEKEKTLLNKLKEAENKLKCLKEEKNLIYKNIIKYTDDINTYNDDMEDIKSESNNNQNKIINVFKKNNNNNLNPLDMFESQMREYDIYQEKKNIILNKINECKLKLSELKKEKNDNKILITKVQKEYKSLKSELLGHYHKILIEGIDTRKEGLQWVIQAIWDLGEEVKMNYMPNFLDIKGINYIFLMAKKNNLLKKVKKYITEFKADSSKKLIIKKITINNKPFLSPIKTDENKLNLSLINNANNTNNNMNREKKEYNIFNTGLKNGNNDDNIIHKIIEYNSPSFIKIRDFIKMKNREERIKYEIKNNFNSRSMSLPSYNQNDKKITLKMFLDTNNNNNSFENIKNNNENLTSSQNIQKKYMDKFNQLKIYQKSIEKDIENTKKNELKRIWNEFTENNYGKKYNTDIKMVISALVGENNMIKEIEKQKCISNELKKIRRICSFYDPYEKGKNISKIYIQNKKGINDLNQSKILENKKSDEEKNNI